MTNLFAKAYTNGQQIVVVASASNLDALQKAAEKAVMVKRTKRFDLNAHIKQAAITFVRQNLGMARKHFDQGMLIVAGSLKNGFVDIDGDEIELNDSFEPVPMAK